MAGAGMFPASVKRYLTGKKGVLKVYNEAELGVQRLRIPGELKDGGEAIHCYVDRYCMPCLWHGMCLCLQTSHYMTRVSDGISAQALMRPRISFDIYTHS